MRHLLTSLRAKLLIIVLLAIGPAAILLFAYAGRQSASAEQRAREDIRRLLEADHRSLQDLLGEARATLVAYADSDAIRQRDWKRAAASARRIKAAQDDYLNVGVVTADGRVVASAVPASGTVDVTDASYYRRAMRDRAFSIGDYEVGRITGHPTFNIAYPVLAPTGEVNEIVYISIDDSVFRRRLSPAGLPVSAVEMLSDSTGRVIVQIPYEAGVEGEHFAYPQLTRATRSGVEGSLSVAGQDGVRREFYYVPVFAEPDGGLYLALGFTPRELFSGGREALALALGGFAVAAGVAGAVAWGLATLWVYWPTERLASAATRIGRGELSARARLKPRRDEMGTLGREFDAMAAALEGRVAELRRARLELGALNQDLEKRVRQRTDELVVVNRIAVTLQESLLAMPATIPGLEFATFYDSATEHTRVGGDFYDLFDLSGSLVAFMIGDVSGKGLEAASLTALVKNALRAHAVEGSMPAEELSKTNRLAQRFTAMETFVTVFFGVLDKRTGTVRYATAGHPPPMLVGPYGVIPLPGIGPLLGAFEPVTYEESRRTLAPGETIVCYTDGVIEARSPRREFFGEARFRDLLGSLRNEDPGSLARLVLEELRDFGEGSLSDDMALLALRPRLEGRPA